MFSNASRVIRGKWGDHEGVPTIYVFRYRPHGPLRSILTAVMLGDRCSFPIVLL